MTRKLDTAFPLKLSNKSNNKMSTDFIHVKIELTFSVESKWNGDFQLGQFVYLFAS